MKVLSIRQLPLLVSLAAALIFAPSLISAQDKDWRPVTAEELAAKTPVVEPDADAEASFWEVRVDDSSTDGVSMKHYVRVKIFTERGREQFSSYDIQFGKNTKIKDVEAKVTKPDGTVVLLKKEDVHERDIVKADGFKVKAKSFAMPGLEVGSILEYRFREVLENASATMPLIFQRDVPIRNISFYIKPFAGDRAMGYHSFNGAPGKFEKDKDGFFRATMNDVPAFHEEPSMLPINEIRAWTYIYYQNYEAKTAQEYWQNLSKTFYEASKDLFKVNDDVKAVTNEVIAGATTDDEKLHRIYDYTKTQIKNTSYAEGVTDEERKKVKGIKNGAEVLRMKMGSSGDIDALFGSMARAAGFEARVAFSGDRSEKFFDPRVMIVRLVLGSSSVAVKVGDDWKFFSPASYFTPYGMLTWQEEDQEALITDPKDLIWKHIPLAAAEATMDKRSGHFTLLDDGTLEGEARIEFSGHRSVYMKRLNRGDSAAEQENTLRDLIKTNILGTAEVEKFTIENGTDPAKPFVYTFKIRVPGYATRTGKRLFFQPNVFERSSKPRFTSNTRKYDIYFSYPYSEQDDITIDLPAGYSLESADAPESIRDKQGIGVHQTEIGVSADGQTLRYKRNFSFGNGGYIRFPAGSYPALKSMFESFNKADVHQLTLRLGAPKN